jgi:hypothetical protein
LAKVNSIRDTMELIYLSGFRGRRIDREGPIDSDSEAEAAERNKLTQFNVGQKLQ